MIYKTILQRRAKGQPMFAILIDPDKMDAKAVVAMARDASSLGVDFFLVGGSLMIQNRLDAIVRLIKNNTKIPVILFPGPGMELNLNVDAILFISLISGRNPELLIGRHVAAAPAIKASGIETIPTGYMLFESGSLTTAHYLSNTLPLPAGKPELAAATASAGELLGMKLIYLEAGSGADLPVSAEIIRAVKNSVDIPLIVGGGLRTAESIRQAFNAGADMVVIGTALEKDPSELKSLIKERKSA